MGIYSTLQTLKTEQLQFVAKQYLDKKSVIKSKGKLIDGIESKIIEYIQKNTNKTQKINLVTNLDIISMWKKCTLEIIQKKKVKSEIQELKNHIIMSLEGLSLKKSDQEIDHEIETICRDILSLLYQDLPEDRQRGFINVLNEELHVNLSRKDFEKILFSNMLTGVAGLPVLIIPVVAQIMLQQLTQGFMGWLLIVILGQQAFQATVLGFLSGPIGWSINIALFLGIAGFSFNKYQSQKEKINFIQAIFSIYSYSYYNNLNF